MVEFNPQTFFNRKELCYYKMIDNFYKKCPEDAIVKMINIIEGQSEISLRVLDWFVTKYARKGVDIPKEGYDSFDVHINYKAQLKSYKKRYFDPFRRKQRFSYKYKVNNETKVLETTIGQLNFFRWAISNKVIGFVETCLAQITKAMNTSNKEQKKKKKPGLGSNGSTGSTGSDFDDSDKDDISDDISDSDSDSEIKDDKPQQIKEVNDYEIKPVTKVKTVRKKGKININAVKTVANEEVELVLSFD